MYSVLKKGRQNNLSIECQLELFDKMVLPILIYGSEIWGFENIDILERVHLQFCKIILHLKQPTPNFIVYAELGRYPITVSVKLRMINFWSRLLNGKESKICAVLYKLVFLYYNDYGINTKWISYIKNIFDNCGMSNIWNAQFADKWVLKCIEQKLKDQFQQECFAFVAESPKTLCYRIFKNNFQLEKYFSVLPYKFSFIHYANIDVVVTTCRFSLEGGRVYREKIESAVSVTKTTSVTSTIIL